MREQVQQIEDMMQGMPPAFLPIKHYFANGMYAREMFMPAGTILTGAVHKTTHFCILSQGHVHVISEDGIMDLVAPVTIVSAPSNIAVRAKGVLQLRRNTSRRSPPHTRPL